MAIPAPTDFGLQFYYGAGSAIAAGISSINLSQYGFVSPNPYDMSFRHEEVPMPESDAVNILSSGHYNGGQMMITTQWFSGSDPDDLRETIEDINYQLWEARTWYDPRACYLRFGLHNGATLIYRRRYCVPISTAYPIQRKTRYRATQTAIAINFAFTDAAWYGDTATAWNITVTNGTSGLVFANPPDGNTDTRRCLFKIDNDQVGETVTDPEVSGLNFSFALDGALSTDPVINYYWRIDPIFNTVIKYTGSSADDIANFTGQFPFINFGVGNLEAITATSDSTTEDWTLEIDYLPRYM